MRISQAQSKHYTFFIVVLFLMSVFIVCVPNIVHAATIPNVFSVSIPQEINITVDQNNKTLLPAGLAVRNNADLPILIKIRKEISNDRK